MLKSLKTAGDVAIASAALPRLSGSRRIARDLRANGSTNFVMTAGEGSFGDEALAFGTRELARLHDKDLSYWFFGSVPTYAAKGLTPTFDIRPHLSRAYSRLSSAGRAALGDADLVVMGADTIGGDYEHRFLAARVEALNTTSRRGHLAKLVNASIPVSPTKLSVRILRRIAPSVEVWARDSQSQEVLADALGRPVHVAPDVGALMPPSQSSNLDWAKREVVSDFITFVPNAHFYTHAGVDRDQLLATWTELLHALAAIAPVVVMPHEIRGYPGDVALAEELSRRSGARVYVPRDSAEAKYILGAARLCVSARMHACVGALSSATPCVGLEYLDKFAGQFKWYGSLGSVVPLTSTLDVPTILRASESLLSNGHGARPDLRSAFSDAWL